MISYMIIISHCIKLGENTEILLYGSGGVVRVVVTTQLVEFVSNL